MTIFGALLELISMHSHHSSPDRVMRSLSWVVKESNDEVGKALKSGIDDYADMIIQEECGFVENLIGAALVTCQAEITSVAGQVVRIHAAANQAGKTLTTTDGQKPSILAFGNPPVGSTGFSQIQMINAFANYFKHSDEWDKPWAKATGKQKHTVAAISAAGAVEFGTGNLRACCDAMNVQPEEFNLFSEIVQRWSATIHGAYQTELKNLNLL